MSAIHPINLSTWGGAVPAAAREAAVGALEAGAVLFLPELRFALSTEELQFLTPNVVGRSKNVSYDPRSGKLGGMNVAALRVQELRTLMDRFAGATRDLLAALTQATSWRMQGDVVVLEGGPKAMKFRPATN